MATTTWLGTAKSVAQVDTATVGGTIETDDLFIFTINGKDLSTAAGSTDADTVADTLVAAFNASTEPEFAEITAAAGSGTGEITLTADTPGKPFTCTVSTTESGGGAADAQTFSTTNTVANKGPNVWNDADNWSEGSVPGASDDVVIENSNVDILWDIDQNSVTVGSLTIRQNFTGTIGLPERNTSGSTSYNEYRETWLKISATNVDIGEGAGGGSGRIKLNVGSNQTAVVVHNTGTPAEQGLESFLFLGTHASNTVEVKRGSVGIGVLDLASATVATLSMNYVTSKNSDANVRCGENVTLTTITKDGGVLETNSNVTTVTQTGGTWTSKAGTCTTHHCHEGTTYYESSGTLTTLNVSAKGTVDFSRDITAKTVTTTTVFRGATLISPADIVTFTNGIKFENCKVADVTFDVGYDKTLTPS